MAQKDFFQEFTNKYVEWNIHNFFDLPTVKGFKLKSPSFLFKSSSWFLEIFPYTRLRDGLDGCIGLYLNKTDSIKEDHVIFNMGIKMSDKIVHQTSDIVLIFGNKSERWGREDFCDRISCFFSTLDKQLTVFCNIRFKDENNASAADISSQSQFEGRSVNSSQEDAHITSSTAQSNYEISCPLSEKDISSLANNFEDLYLSRRYADVTIIVQNKEFLAHRSIIAARSSVFASMFDHDTVEKSTGRIEITDCDPENFDNFLLFLYSGNLDVVRAKNAIHLYKTAEKYDVRELKKECLECMICFLSVDNFPEVVQLATMYNECGLLDIATVFFIDNARAILLTTKWKFFLEKNLTLGNELFLKYIESKENP